MRWLLSLEPFMQDFLAAYPGEYPLPEGAPVGIPPWLGWQHFFNVFLIVLIIRSGLQVRTEKRPSVFWSPRNNGKRKISLNLWFHQSLDILWIVNGVIFVVLLFVTGQWMKIVPTSWAVFPNAISAALQYVSLDWPTENGWVNYNSLQQLAYFATVFIAAPLAIATGVRMSRDLAEERQGPEQGVPGGVGARGALPGDALLRRVHHRPRRARVRHRGAAQPEPHVRVAGRRSTGSGSGSSPHR